jgi:hypothetical protein
VGVFAIGWKSHGLNGRYLLHCSLALHEMQRLKRLRKGIHQRCFVPGRFAKRVLAVFNQSDPSGTASPF